MTGKEKQRIGKGRERIRNGRESKQGRGSGENRSRLKRYERLKQNMECRNKFGMVRYNRFPFLGGRDFARDGSLRKGAGRYFCVSAACTAGLIGLSSFFGWS